MFINLHHFGRPPPPLIIVSQKTKVSGNGFSFFFNKEYVYLNKEKITKQT